MRHARTQLIERYGLHNCSLAELTETIKAGRAKFIHAATSDRGIYDVPYTEVINGTVRREVTVRVVAELETAGIITVLPPEFRGRERKARAKQVRKQFYRELAESDHETVSLELGE